MNLRFDNAFIRDLAGDPSNLNRPRQVHNALWSRVAPTAVAAPRLIAWSQEVADLVGIERADVESLQFAQVFGGNEVLTGMEPYAANYGGHQFGNWAGQLGDGRALTLGETVSAAGQRWELQLKGAGPTPYSRSADGRAVLRSSVREFLCSEAMHHLGVPTTRALSLVATGEQVWRDMFYDGRAAQEPGAIVCRVAPSFIRFGNFELPASRGDVAMLDALITFTIRRDFQELLTGDDVADPAVRGEWFGQVCERTARMVAHWMRVGFVHGVMNTDNMSILGVTIDYGPYGWIDDFDPEWTPNTTDAGGRRYRFGHQAQVAHWNLGRLATALSAVFPDTSALEAGLERFVAEFNAQSRANVAAKLGFTELRDDDILLSNELYDLMHEAESLSDGFPHKHAWCALAYASSVGYDDDARAALQAASEEFCRSGSLDPTALVARARLMNASDTSGHTLDGDALLWEFKESFPRIAAWLLRQGEGVFYLPPPVQAPTARSSQRWEAIKTQ